MPLETQALEIDTALKLATEDATGKNVKALYSTKKSNSSVNVICQVIEKIQDEQSLDAKRMGEIAAWFADKAPDREPVKFSMALLGVLIGADATQLYLTLGRHSEFTLYAAEAISINYFYGEDILWQLAKSTQRLGRYHAVKHLADTDDPEIKDWPLREGYKDGNWYGDLAAICALAGELHLALQAEQVDDVLFSSAFEIIDRLASGRLGDGDVNHVPAGVIDQRPPAEEPLLFL